MQKTAVNLQDVATHKWDDALDAMQWSHRLVPAPRNTRANTMSNRRCPTDRAPWTFTLPDTTGLSNCTNATGRGYARPLAAAVAMIWASLSAIGWGQQVSFREHVQPLLADRCFRCHGPDENTREADLRLDTEAGAKDHVIEPGNADGSELIARIESDDPDAIMPPIGHGDPLSEDERKLLREWINQGAPWQGHWAFEPIQRPEVPADESGWCSGPIDQFVLRRMKAAGLEPSARASDRTLIRRLYFDLIGLPPTPEQVDQCMSVTGQVDWEALVDRLLASRHYGEQMAVDWLDVARFADTNGYQNDFVRSMWVWRDWVIDAFNRNMPYDQFIVEQIAGDMLPQPTLSQQIASGFNRNNPSVTEGGSIEEEWRVENCVDRVETTSAAFLGLTIGCARCHDHKYDPISQTEFYEFFAFFNNVDERGVYIERRGNAPPLVSTPTPDQVAALSALDEQIAALRQRISATENVDARAELRQWRETAGQEGDNLPMPRWSLNVDQDQGQSWSPAGRAFTFAGDGTVVPGFEPPAMTFERDQSFSWTGWIHGDARGALFGKMDEGASYRGADTLILGDGRLKAHLISTWKSNAIAVVTNEPLLAGTWNHVAVTYDGSSKAAGFRIYINGLPATTANDQDSLTDTTVTELPFTIGQRSRSEFLRGRLARVRLYAEPLTDDQVSTEMKRALVAHVDRVAIEKLDASATEASHAFVQQTRVVHVLREQASLEARRKKMVASHQTTMVMRERSGEYRPTWFLNRGQYDQPVKDVDLWPSIPSALPGLSPEQPRNRLGLARWLVDDRNPLVARVIVNRAWLKFFGRGLVDPLDNFGVQGSPPSHPELLDWLADDFRSHGWDLKRLHRQIVLSAAYQQASDLTEDRRQRDRENRWISRGPRYRLSAEQIRDSALLFGGLLSHSVGGPSVFPYQPDGLWDELAGGANNGPYVQSNGSDLYRRSLYTYRKRTVPHPTTSTFDAPSWEKCQIKRANTNTPLQALALLNDTTYVEAARHFAARILQAGGPTLDDRIGYAMRVALSRPPTATEKATLVQGFRYYLAFYEANVVQAQQLLAVGDSTSDPSDAAELAAMTSVASVILNLDSTMTKE